MERWNKIAERGMRFALAVSDDIKAVHIQLDDNDDAFVRDWKKLIEDPIRNAKLAVPELVCLPSPFRYVITPIVDYVLDLSKQHPDRTIAVIVPELVEDKWYHYPLHNQRAQSLKGLLLLHGSKKIVTMNVPWYLHQ